ncbi:DUF1236 domain-containing protein [Pseudorhodoplanes sp.]|uniref:DUF1236 domain-containing protein n=1 Tax=Pseudorhodoplanes sp. TaxID=1934341 RepID=UPI003D0EA9D2
MPHNPAGNWQQRGTRNLFIGGAITAGILLVAVSAWPLWPGSETGDSNRSPNASDPGPHSAAGQKSDQNRGESNTGAAEPSRPEDSAGGKAQSIQQTAKDLSLTEDQHQALRSYFARHDGAKVNDVAFSISVGSAVPRDQELKATPKDVTGILKGYQGSDYLLVRDQLVIIDHEARRVVAIVPGTV